MDDVEYENDCEKQEVNEKDCENQSLCGSNILRKLISRHFAREENQTEVCNSVVKRKLSSNWTYKLKDEKSSVKTLWPIACREFLFLPEFKIRNNELKENYEIIEFVAKGNFGKVYKVQQRTATSQIFALKVLEKSKIILDNYVNQLKDEVSIQKAISHHPFIVTSQEHWQDKGHIYQLTEFISEGELFEKIKHFTNKLIQLYVAELSIVIEFLHNAGIIYRDLKSENILLDENYHIKLTDFGLSKWLKLGQRTFTICGTKNLMAPEIFDANENGYTHAVDWYSMGVLTKIMMEKQMLHSSNETCDKPPELDNCLFDSFDQVDDAQRHEDVEVIKMDMTHDLEPASKDLLNRLMEKNPQLRLKSILALKRIAFFHNFNFDDVRHRKISPRKLIEDDNLEAK